MHDPYGYDYKAPSDVVLEAMLDAEIPVSSLSVARLTDALLRRGCVISGYKVPAEQMLE